MVGVLNLVLKSTSVPKAKLNNRRYSEVGVHVPKCTVHLDFSFKWLLSCLVSLIAPFRGVQWWDQTQLARNLIVWSEEHFLA